MPANPSKVHLPPAKKSAITRQLDALHNSCVEALTGDWDRSDQGFHDMIQVLADLREDLEIKDNNSMKEVPE